MNTAAIRWATDLASWGIPQEILDQAPTSPWIHPPALFGVPETIADTPSHFRAREAITDGGSVLDVGCGGGIAAFAVTPPAAHVIGVDHQSEMLDMFQNNAHERGLTCDTFLGDWPDVAANVPMADVVTCHHVVFNVSNIVPFLEGLNARATNRVVIEMPTVHPLASMSAAWEFFWDLKRPTSPTSTDLMNVLREMNIDAHLEEWDSPLGREVPMALNVEFTRIRLCLDSSRDSDIENFLRTHPAASTRKISTIWWDV